MVQMETRGFAPSVPPITVAFDPDNMGTVHIDDPRNYPLPDRVLNLLYALHFSVGVGFGLDVSGLPRRAAAAFPGHHRSDDLVDEARAAAACRFAARVRAGSWKRCKPISRSPAAAWSGLTLALALAQGGLRRRGRRSVDPRADGGRAFDGRVAALAFASVRMLKVLGVWERLEKDAQPIDDILVNEGTLGRGPDAVFAAFRSPRDRRAARPYRRESPHPPGAASPPWRRRNASLSFRNLGQRARDRRGSRAAHAVATAAQFARLLAIAAEGRDSRVARSPGHRHRRLGLRPDRHRDDGRA